MGRLCNSLAVILVILAGKVYGIFVTLFIPHSLRRYYLMRRVKGIVLVSLLALSIGIPVGAQQTFTEDFTTDMNKDAAKTTADWHTGDGELKLPATVAHLSGSTTSLGSPSGIAIAGATAYVATSDIGSSGALEIFDLTDPLIPILMGSYTFYGDANAVAVYGNIAYLANQYEFKTVDVSDPTAPLSLGSHFDGGAVFRNAVDIRWPHAFVAIQQNGVQIYDVNDPTSISLVNTIAVGGNARDVVVRDYLYVAAGAGGLEIYEFTSPTTVSLLGSLALAGDARDLVITTHYAYVASGSGGLHVVDISDPTTPALRGTAATPSDADDVILRANTAYVSGAGGGVHVIDITIPAAPILDATIVTVGSAKEMARYGSHAFVADGSGGMQTIRVASPGELTSGSSVGIGGSSAWDVDIVGNLAFVAGQTGGIKTVDITDPSAMVQLSGFPVGGNCLSVEAVGHLVYAGVADSLSIVDMSDPTLPVLLSSLSMGGGDIARGLTVQEDIAYLVTGNLGVFDVSDPTAPVLLYMLDDSNYYHAPIVIGDVLYLQTRYNGMRVFDVSNPALPVLTQSLLASTIGEWIWDVEVYGDILYVGSQYNITVYDISDVAIPVQVNKVAVRAGGMTIDGERIYSGENNLNTVDISDPHNPVLLHTRSLGGQPSNMKANAGHLYVVGSNGGTLRSLTYDNALDIYANIGQSTVYGTGTTIVKARLATTEDPNVVWEMSGDGTNWGAINSDDQWTSVPEDDGILWRATLDVTIDVPEPVVYDIDSDWLTDISRIMSVTDAPDDQGGNVIIQMERSGYDFADEIRNPITMYNVWVKISGTASLLESIEGQLAARSKLDNATLPIVTVNDNNFVLSRAQSQMPPGLWAQISDFPAIQQHEYGIIAETLADSTDIGTQLNSYCVTAHTAAPAVWFASLPSSGYSVDNLAPGVPVAVVANYGAGNVGLDWADSPEVDFRYYRIYRSTDPGFVPGPGNLVQQTVDSDWNDVIVDPWTQFYKITAVDYTGNESAPGSPTTTTATPENILPTRTDLFSAVPNPFNPQTRLSFDMAAPGMARLAVYDVAGRLVTTLVNEHREAGHHSVVWNGRDANGQMSATGVYFCRFGAVGFTKSMRMVLIK